MRVGGSQPSSKTAIVTGAGSGIGSAVARRLAAEAFAVVLVGRRPELLPEVQKLIQRDGGAAWAMPTDVSDPHAPGRLVADTLATLGRIDVIVNNAAVIRTHPLAEFSGSPVRLGGEPTSRFGGIACGEPRS